METITINWKKLMEAFSKISYSTFDENINNNDIKPKFMLSDDQREAMEESQKMIETLPQLNTWNYPLEKMNPDLITMILNLNERLLKIENNYKHRIEVLEQDNLTLKSIFICNKEESPEPPNGNGTLEELEVYNNNHKEKQEEFNLSEEIKKLNDT